MDAGAHAWPFFAAWHHSPGAPLEPRPRGRQAAVEEGIVPGGGVALLYASRALDAVRDGLTSFDQRIGVRIVQSALKVPLKTIADNAGARPPAHLPAAATCSTAGP